MTKQTAIAVFFTFSAFAALANTPVDPKEKETEMINGLVIDITSKKPLKDVNITAILHSKKEKAVFSDANGGYRFVMLKPGTYKIIFEKEGYKKVVKEKVQVTQNAPVQINIEMPEIEPFTERGPSAWHFFDS